MLQSLLGRALQETTVILWAAVADAEFTSLLDAPAKLLDAPPRCAAFRAVSSPLVALHKLVKHLGAALLVPTLGVKDLLVRAAVEDALGAAGVAGDRVERLNHAQAQLLALVLLGDANLLDVPDAGPIPNAARVKSLVSLQGGMGRHKKKV